MGVEDGYGDRVSVAARRRGLHFGEQAAVRRFFLVGQSVTLVSLQRLGWVYSSGCTVVSEVAQALR